MLLLFITLHPFLKVPPLMVLWFSTVPSNLPSLMVLLFITLHPFWKVPPLMVPLFVTVPLKAPPDMVPLFVTVPLKAPPTIFPSVPHDTTLFSTMVLKVPS